VLNVLLVFFVTPVGAVAQAASKPGRTSTKLRRISRGTRIIYLKPVFPPKNFGCYLVSFLWEEL
jgi:hypothetical protein